MNERARSTETAAAADRRHERERRDIADIADIEDLKERARIERMTLELGKALATQRDQYTSIEEVIELAKTISPLQ